MALHVLPTVERLDLASVRLPESHPAASRGDPVPVYGYLIRHPDGPIVVDTGVGHGNDLIDEAYRPERTGLAEALSALEVDIADVVAVVNSHLHFDHCGQNGLLYGGRTQFYVQRAEVASVRDVPHSLRRFLTCDAKVRAVLEDAHGAVLGISPQEPTVNRRLRRIIEQRDGGCRYPGCSQTRWAQVHHIVHREDGGLTVASNLVGLCPHHHRAHHQGAFEITGDPEQPHGLRFSDRWGRAIGPPRYGPPAPPPVGDAPTFTPPTGERLEARWFSWN